MNRPIGFGGGGMWALLILIIAGVGWVNSNFGPTMAGYALIAVAGAVFLLFGILACIAAMQAFGNILEHFWKFAVGIEKARSRVHAQEARIKLAETNHEARFQQAVMRQAMFLGRQIGANYKSQISANQSETPALEDDDDPYVINLDQGNYQIVDDD